MLNHKVTIYVPSTVDVNKEINNTEYVNKVLEKLSTYFGGATCTEATGCWMSETAGLVRESITMCYAFCDKKAYKDHFNDVKSICEWLKTEMNQEAISLEIDNVLEFI